MLNKINGYYIIILVEYFINNVKTTYPNFLFKQKKQKNYKKNKKTIQEIIKINTL